MQSESPSFAQTESLTAARSVRFSETTLPKVKGATEVVSPALRPTIESKNVNVVAKSQWILPTRNTSQSKLPQKFRIAMHLGIDPLKEVLFFRDAKNFSALFLLERKSGLFY